MPRYARHTAPNSRLARLRALIPAGVLTVFYVIVIAAVVGYLGYIAVKPFVLAGIKHAECKKLEARRDAQLAANKAQGQDNAYLLSPDGADEMGRRQGMVKPGEIAVTIHITPAALAQTVQAQETVPIISGGQLLFSAGLLLAMLFAGTIFLLRHRAVRARARAATGVLRTRAELRRQAREEE